MSDRPVLTIEEAYAALTSAILGEQAARQRHWDASEREASLRDALQTAEANLHDAQGALYRAVREPVS